MENNKDDDVESISTDGGSDVELVIVKNVIKHIRIIVGVILVMPKDLKIILRIELVVMKILTS